MSLATRCTSCGTIFRVVQDQLKVCEGWVRCGQCDEVFSALEGLFDLDRDVPPVWTAVVEPPAAAPESSPDLATFLSTAQVLDSTETTREWPSSVGESAPVGETMSPMSDLVFSEPPREPILEHDGATRALADPLHSARSEAEVGDSALDIATATSAVAPPDAVRSSVEPTEVPPEFLRHANREARWARPRIRATLGVFAVGLLAALTLQIAHHFRDLFAAQLPAAKPLIASWCGVVGCVIGAPERIEHISLESSALNRAAAPDSYRLAVTMRNRSPLALALPAVELSLTDATGQLLARRALTPRDFRVTSLVLQPKAETTLQLVLNAGSSRVSGYTVEVFYP